MPFPLRSCLVFALLLAPAWAQEAEPSPSEPVEKETVPELAARATQDLFATQTSIPFQGNYDFNIGPDGDGEQFLLNLQPIIPFHLTESLNLITRTVLPIVDQRDVAVDGSGETRQTGIGDLSTRLFLSPTTPIVGGVVWGLGPRLVFQTASDDFLGAGKWSAGPSLGLVKRFERLTVWTELTHIWSFAGDDERSYVSRSSMFSFVGYAVGGGFTLSAVLETTYDWRTYEWTIPINVGAAYVLPSFGQLIQFFAAGRYYLSTPDNDGPEWGVRFGVAFLFPEGPGTEESP